MYMMIHVYNYCINDDGFLSIFTGIHCLQWSITVDHCIMVITRVILGHSKIRYMYVLILH